MNQFQSLWVGTSDQTNYPQLESDFETDVAIIGGGLAGISAAYFLSNLGLKVAVFEAERLAEKTSGNTTAKVTVFHDLKYAFLKEKFGADGAKVYAISNQWAIEEMENVIKKENISCQWLRQSVYGLAQTQDGLEKIKQELEAASEAGLKVAFLDKDETLPFNIQGEIEFANQAMFHPRKFILGLAERLAARGVSIFEKTQVRELEEEDGFCYLDAGDYKVRAKQVIIATNYPMYDKGLFFFLAWFSKLSKGL